jgi:hypothetical protein
MDHGGTDMEVQTVKRPQLELTNYLKRFEHCFPRKDTCGHLPVYIERQLSDPPRKSVERIAIEADISPQILREFFSQRRWGGRCDRNQLQEIVGTEHVSAQSNGIINHRIFLEKGHKASGVRRQLCSGVANVANCMVTVQRSYDQDRFHLLLASGSCAREGRADDRNLPEQAGRLDEVTDRSEWQTGCRLYGASARSCAHYHRITFVELHTDKRPFLCGLSGRSDRCVDKIPRNFVCWLKPSGVIVPPFCDTIRGGAHEVTRLASGNAPPRGLDEILENGVFRGAPPRRSPLNAGGKGPTDSDTTRRGLTPEDMGSLPGEPMHSIEARGAWDPNVIKCSARNTPPETRIQSNVLAPFSRVEAEQRFADRRGAIGLEI